MNESTFKPGDVVVLKSDTEHKMKMTISMVFNDRTAVCYYFDPITFDVKLLEASQQNGIPLDILVKI